MRKYINLTTTVAFAATLLWCAASWFIARAHFLSSAADLTRQALQESDVRAEDLVDSIAKNLNYFSGSSDLLAHDPLILQALSSSGASPIVSLPAAETVRHRSVNPALEGISRYLVTAKTDLNVETIAVANAAGDCIVSSNSADTSSCIGVNIADREYFRMNREGKQGMQIAVGKVSRVPGIFFSSPVLVKGRFAGVVVVKVSIPSLSFLVRQTDTYVADRNGVILLSHDPEKEMLSLPGAAVNRMSGQAKLATYQRTNFSELKMVPWGYPDFTFLQRIQGEGVPHIVASKELQAYGLTAFVERELGEFLELENERDRLFPLLALSGALLILLATSIFVYLRATHRAKTDTEHQAGHDALTLLPNRRLLMSRLNEGVLEALRSGNPLALLLIDLDGFKEVNDAFGHPAGDRLLVDAAARIRSCLRAADTVARFGGDEFVVILPDCGHDDVYIESTARDILGRLTEPFILTEPVLLTQESADVSASIGIVRFPGDGDDANTLLKRADQAMYAAKQAGRKRFHFFTAALEEAAQKRRALIKDLRQAIPQNQLHVHYQPIVDLKTGAVRKAEALIRWQHPVRGFISPIEFIPLAESSGMIMEIGDWMFRHAARQAQLWRNEFDSKFQISVNKSPLQFKNPMTRQGEPWISHLATLGLHGDGICVEITEGLLLHAEDEVNETLLNFSRAGIQMAIDDFGTGYSSLAYLKKFDINYLKIDKVFVADLVKNYDNLILCETIISMAHNLGLQVVAEGVETTEQRGILYQLGCDYGQGYLFSKPVPPDEFKELLVCNNNRVTIRPSLLPADS